MGFSELVDDYVQTAGWNMDALFIPQDHPAREMQDTFYLDNPASHRFLMTLVMPGVTSMNMVANWFSWMGRSIFQNIRERVCSEPTPR